MRVSQSVPQATLRPGNLGRNSVAFWFFTSKNWVYQVPKMAILIGNVMINLEDPWGVHYFQTNPQQIAWNPSSWGVRLVTRCFSMPQHLVSWFLDAFSVVLDEPCLNAVGIGNRMHPTLFCTSGIQDRTLTCSEIKQQIHRPHPQAISNPCWDLIWSNLEWIKILWLTYYIWVQWQCIRHALGAVKF